MTDPAERQEPSRGYGKAVAVGTSAVATAVLAVATVVGLYVRPAADDWCIAANTATQGTWGLVRYFYVSGNGRAANGAFNGLVYSFGTTGPKVLPGLLVLSLVVGTAVLTRQLLSLVGRAVPAVACLAVGLTATMVVLLGGGVAYQVFFWAPGSISHTLPSVLGVWATVAVLAARSASAGRRSAAVAAAAVTAFVIGTLSEPYVVVSGVVAGVVCAAAAWAVLRHGRGRFALLSSAAWLLGLIAGFGLLLVSPGLDQRRRVIEQAPLLSLDGIGDVLSQWGRTWAEIAQEPAYLAPLGVGVLLGVLSSRVSGEPRRSRRLGPLLLLLPVATLAVATVGVTAGLRSGYGPNGWTYERVWTNFLSLLVGVLVFYGWWLGERLRSRSAPALLVATTAAAGLVLPGFLVVVPRLDDLRQEMVARAESWDHDDGAARRALADGERSIAYHPVPIGGLREPFAYRASADWQVRCMKVYYGADEVRPAPSWLESEDSRTYRRYLRDR